MGFIELFDKVADSISPIADNVMEFIITKWYWVIVGIVVIIFLMFQKIVTV